MSDRARSLTTATLIVVMAVALLFLISTQPATVNRVEEIGARIKCPVCQGESIANSPSPMAEDMMDLVSERVAAGFSDQQIIDELLSSYSGALLLDPPPSGNTLVLWVAPVAALVVGLAVIAWWKRHPGPAEQVSVSPSGQRSRTRLLTGGLILVAAFAAIVVLASNSLQDRAASASGAADLGDQDLADVSNETMEAVIAANLDNPEVNGMRLALAERYFELGDYRSAFPHYLVVAEDVEADPAQAITALVRLGWMAYDGNGEVETATRLVDEALAIDPESSVALYALALIRWCGSGEAEAAAQIFEGLLGDPELATETRTRVESDLRLAQDGEDCQ
ncbi:MAG TPA: cytochrome c-type biogenesis protein CcmH [Acidimicrobiia bacterium]|nr:cytochrome c-type biogenesis protein CcmH [Acidimicrobiia bacterium]